MTILAESAGWNSTITDVLLVVHVAVCLLLCLTVLMQRPKQEGLGAAFGGGMTDQAFGARTTDVLQKGTVYLASLLFIITLVLSILVGTKSRAASITEELENDKSEQVEDNAAKVAEGLEADNADEIDLGAEVEKVIDANNEDAEAPAPVVPAPVVPAPATPAAPATDQ